MLRLEKANYGTVGRIESSKITRFEMEIKLNANVAIWSGLKKIDGLR
jgi:hypothetical protein